MNKPGFFSDDFSTYTITEMFSPRPWFNFMWNERFIAQIDQFGFGKSWHCYEDGRRTNLNVAGSRSDLGTVMDNRLIFLRDQKDNSYWAANRNYHNEDFDKFQTVVSQGYSTIMSEYKGIGCDFRLFIPPQGPFECWSVTLSNNSDSVRKISLFAYANASLHMLPHTACASADFDEQLNGLVLHHNSPKPPTDLTHTFFTADRQPSAWETTDRRFRGVYGTLTDPKAVITGNLASKGTNFEWQAITALQFDLEIQPHSTERICLIQGLARSIDEARSIKNNSLSAECFDAMINKMDSLALDRNSKLTVNTGEKDIDAMASVWLKQQISLGKSWGRVYAKGFRDIMQDSTALASFDSNASARSIIHCLEHQYANGNSMRQWNPPWDHPYRDGPAWLPSALESYLKETGDFDFLERQVKFCDTGESSVLDHCRRGMGFLLNNLGSHGLCLWGGGDWNDSLNSAGLAGKGESAWLSQAAVLAARVYCNILNILGLVDEADAIAAKADSLTFNLRHHAWDTDHFICGYNDKGEQIGAYGSPAGQFFLNPQSWAVLADIAVDPHALMDTVEDKLRCNFGYAIAKPAYFKGDHNIGLATFMAKGCCENGAVYNHGVAFKIVADCKLGRAEHAYETLRMILHGHGDNPQNTVEPYVVTNQYLGPENPWRAGEANGTWITGTAGWVYRCITESMIGIQADYDGLAVRPCLPKKWTDIHIQRQFRGTLYDITIENHTDSPAGTADIIVDGQANEGNILPVFDDGKTHFVTVSIL